jgi:arginine decarboxylase
MISNRYFDLIDQTFYFPQEGFDIEDGNLVFNGVPLMYLIKKYGTPLKLTYLPKIGAQIKKAEQPFHKGYENQWLPGQVQLLLLHQKLPFQLCGEGGAEA